MPGQKCCFRSERTIAKNSGISEYSGLNSPVSATQYCPSHLLQISFSMDPSYFACIFQTPSVRRDVPTDCSPLLPSATHRSITSWYLAPSTSAVSTLVQSRVRGDGQAQTHYSTAPPETADGVQHSEQGLWQPPPPTHTHPHVSSVQSRCFVSRAHDHSPEDRTAQVGRGCSTAGSRSTT